METRFLLTAYIWAAVREGPFARNPCQRRGVEAEEVEHALEKIIAAYIETRKDGDSFSDFCHTRSSDDLASIINENFKPRSKTDD